MVLQVGWLVVRMSALLFVSIGLPNGDSMLMMLWLLALDCTMYDTANAFRWGQENFLLFGCGLFFFAKPIGPHAFAAPTHTHSASIWGVMRSRER